MILMNWESPRALISLRLGNRPVFTGKAERCLTASVGRENERETLSKKTRAVFLMQFSCSEARANRVGRYLA
jgi:hypothetical protein